MQSELGRVAKCKRLKTGICAAPTSPVQFFILNSIMIYTLLLKKGTEDRLWGFGTDVQRILNLPSFEARQSDNCPNGEYLKCEVLGLKVKAAFSDSSDFPDYHFSLSFEPQGSMIGEGLLLNGLADIIARRLALNDYKVVLEEERGRPGTQYTTYHKNQNPDVYYTEQVVVEHS